MNSFGFADKASYRVCVDGRMKSSRCEEELIFSLAAEMRRREEPALVSFQVFA